MALPRGALCPRGRAVLVVLAHVDERQLPQRSHVPVWHRVAAHVGLAALGGTGLQPSE